MVETACTTIAAWGSTVLAEGFHVSGAFAAVTAGLIMGNLGTSGPISPRGKEAVQAFWEYAAFMANPVIFLLIGMRLTISEIASIWPAALLAVAVVLLGRAASVYPISALFSRSSWRIRAEDQHVLFWGGLRGALALASVMGVPAQVSHHGQIIGVVFVVVAVSIVFQGLTIPFVLRKAGAPMG